MFIKNICRLCLKNIENGEGVNLFALIDLNILINHDTDRKLTISNIVMEFISIKLDESTDEVICKVCENQIIECYKFKLQCEINDKQFQKLKSVYFNNDNNFENSNGETKTFLANHFDDDFDISSSKSFELNIKTQNSGVKNENTNFCQIFDKRSCRNNLTEPHEISKSRLIKAKNFDLLNSIQYDIRKDNLALRDEDQKPIDYEDEDFVVETKRKKAKRIRCDICGLLIQNEKVKIHFENHLLFLKRVNSFNVTKQDLMNNFTLCAICLKTFKCFDSLSGHMAEEHLNSKQFQCCNKNWTNLTDFDEHLNKNHLFLKEICLKCLKSFNSRSKLSFKVHFTKHMNGAKPILGSQTNKCKCFVCSKKQMTYFELIDHMYSHFDLTYSCEICETKMESKNDLANHMKRIHENIPSCRFCGLNDFKSPSDLKQHIRWHIKSQDQIFCKICNKMIEQRLYSTHKISHANGFCYKCDFCDLYFFKPEHLKAHQHQHGKHLKTTQVKCRFLNCNKMFSKISSRKRHELVVHCDNLETNNMTNKVQEQVNSNLERSKMNLTNTNQILIETNEDQTLMNYQENDDKVLIDSLTTKENYDEFDAVKVNSKKDAIRCDICGVSIRTKNLKVHFDEHLLFLKGVSTFNVTKEDILNNFTLCWICLKKFNCWNELNRHLSDGHQNSTAIECCDKHFDNLNSYDDHLNNNHSFLKQACLKCLKTFDFPKITLGKHYATHLRRPKQILGSLTNIAECLVCSKAQMNYFELIDHMYSHFDLTYSCDLCVIEMKSRKELDKHFDRKHSNKEIGCCQYCGRNNFESKTQLNDHVTTHRVKAKEPIECDICHKMLKPRSLASHKLFHEGVYRYSCSICGQKFLQTTSLKDHMVRKHSNEKPFKCSFNGCDKRFSAKFARKTHERIHTGEKPFQCQVCLKYLPYYSSVIRHRFMHSGEKPFKCTVCDKSYRDKPKRDMHMKKKHPNVAIPKRARRELNVLYSKKIASA